MHFYVTIWANKDLSVQYLKDIYENRTTIMSQTIKEYMEKQYAKGYYHALTYQKLDDLHSGVDH